jgi:hypothetical protein
VEKVMTRASLIRITAASVALPVLLAVSPVMAQDVKQIPVDPDKSKGEKSVTVQDPMQVFKGIERAWHNENAEALSRYVGDDRVRLDVRGMGKQGGYYSKAQVKYLFKDMFKTDDQLKFEFVKFHNLEAPDRKVYGIAYRSCKNHRSGKVFQDKVYVTLGREGPEWVVAEIKTTH